MLCHQACGRFINNNSVTKLVNSTSKSPELLARYCDLLLKKRYKTTPSLPFHFPSCLCWLQLIISYKVQNLVCADYFKCMHMHARMHTHTHTHTYEHSDYTKLNLHSLRQAADLGWMKTAAWNRKKTWQVYSFGKRNVLRLHLNESREGFCWRSFRIDGLKTEKAQEPTVENLVQGIGRLRVSEVERSVWEGV